ncbi:hypothetical protein H7142_02735 [Candidatus Saccharibacteria bacterium]|nr:hypothetical protein [Candidatus Saccharibacteria bacterium]
MTFERESFTPSVELTVGSTDVLIEDMDNLVKTVVSSTERVPLASAWFHENFHEHLLESAVTLEMLDNTERTLHGQILLEPITDINQPDATLITLYSYLVTVLGYDKVPSAFETDFSGRWVIAIGDTSNPAMYIRVETLAPDTINKRSGAHQINLSMKLSEIDSDDFSKNQIIDFFKLWAATHDFIHNQSSPSVDASGAVKLTIPSSRLEDEELRIWQVLSEFEMNQQNDTKQRYPVDIAGIDIGTVATAAKGLDDPTIHRALTRVVITKIVTLSLTGNADAITTDEIIASINRTRPTE